MVVKWSACLPSTTMIQVLIQQQEQPSNSSGANTYLLQFMKLA